MPALKSARRSVPASNSAQGSVVRSSDAEPTQYALEQELRFLRDPLKLADNTVSLLKTGQHEKAGQLVRMASRSMACTVSWNHMMDYEMSKGRVSRAMTIYNDVHELTIPSQSWTNDQQMKKRAQQPDAHTFTILLRGLAWHSNYGKSLERALALYHSMYAPSSPVRPSLIHTNATLNVCARAGDLDALWGVAARLPTTGPRAPDKATFTTIFNAVRHIIHDDSQRSADQDIQETIDRRQKAVSQGRRMWAEIIDRWKSGDIAIDEELVCAVGRMLLLADVPQDLHDLLSLMEQTMGIPRQKPRPEYLNEGRGKTEETSSAEGNSLIPMTQPERKPLAASDDDFIPGSEFLPVSSVNPRAYSRPGQQTLSLLLDACTRLRLIDAAQDYWGLLTSAPYNITPDTENYHMYLRLLRVQRASRLCVDLVQEMRQGLGIGPTVPKSERKGIKGEAGGVQAKTFRIALGACKRDIKNPNVVDNAAKLVRLMIDCLPDVDARVLSMYVDVSTGAAGHDWRRMSAALRGSEIGVRQLRSMLNFGGWEVTTSDTAGLVGEKDRDKFVEIYEFLNKLVGAYDRLLNEHGELMLREERKRCVEQKAMLAAWQTRLSRRLGMVVGSRRHWGVGKREEGRVPERGDPGNVRHVRREVRLGVRQLELGGGWRDGSGSGSELGDEDEMEAEQQQPREQRLRLRDALEKKRRNEKYTRGGANKRMAMAAYLRSVQEGAM